MRQTLPVLVTVLLAMAAVATGTPVPLPTGTDAGDTTAPSAQVTHQQGLAAPIEPLQNTSSYLALPGGSRQQAEFGNATLDVAGATAMDTGQYQTAFTEAATIEAFESAETATERTAVLERAVSAIENRTTALRNRQQRSIATYNRGDLSTTTLLQRIAIIDAESRRLNEFIETLDRTASRTPGYSLPNSLRTRLQSLRAEPIVFQGHIRDSIGRSLTGEDETFSVYVETTSDGIVLAQLSGNRYIREAFIASEFQQPGPDQFSQSDQPAISAAYERARTLYPWTFNNTITNPSATGYGSTSVYQITSDHTQGRLVSYIDGTTTNVFREIQERRLSRLPFVINATNSTPNLTVRASLTHESGPMQVTVTEFDTGDAVDARITLDGQFVGETGPDGRLWTIRPNGPVTVNATASDRSVTLGLGS